MKRLLQCRTRADTRQFVKVCMALLFLVIILIIYKLLSQPHDGRHVVLWYNPPFYVRSRPDAFEKNFDGCPQANCRLTFDRSEAESSKAIIFDGRQITIDYQTFSRPQDQLWVFWGNEPPTKYYESGDAWMDFAREFNLTMTYHRESDVYMPYGEIVPTMPIPQKDFLSITQQKNHSVVWIASSCHTSSWREVYVKELRKYVDVDTFGRCSDEMKPWNCGNRWEHDDCFSILNDYKFYLAFENSFCEDYITEKFFDNYNYDTIMVTRGGTKSNFKNILPDGVYIDAMDFRNPKELAEHLTQFLNDDAKYAKLLERKSAFTSLPYHIVYQKSLCNLCDRVMYPDVYNVARYDNLRDTFHESNFCKHPSDLERKHQR